MTAYPANSTRCLELTRKLVAGAERICDYMDRINTGSSTLSPIEFDRLLDDYRSEMIRYDRLDRELAELEGPKKTSEAKERLRMTNLNRNKYNY